MGRGESLRILMAEDDEDDRMIAEEAFAESHLNNPLEVVEDGVQLLDYLHRRNEFQHLRGQPLPGLILLDLNMPRMNGFEVLKRIKDTPHLRQIPVIVLTTSQAEEDVLKTYELGVNSYIAKPVTFDGLVTAVQILGQYWFEIVELPPRP